jgi:hypothetical protein
MKTRFNKALHQNYEEYQELFQNGEIYSAVIRLAEIFVCLPSLNRVQQKEWKEILEEVSLSDKSIKAIEIGVQKDLQRITKILSVGNKWNEDEILLLLLKRINIDIVLHYLKERYKLALKISLSDTDALIENALMSKQNELTYKKVINQMGRHTLLPIETKWLELK